MDLTTIQPELIAACIARDTRAEYALYKATYSYLMSICVRYTKSEEAAKEALNSGFLRIIINLNKYKTDVPFKAWIRRVMINTLINEYKKEKTHYDKIEYVETYNEQEAYSQINEAITKINAQEIIIFINKLPPASQQVFNLYCVDGYKHGEIAALLGISEGTSKWHLNSAREKLKQLLSPMNTSINK